MLEAEWNALRSGDRVLVHDAVDPAHALQAGVVLFVEVQRRANDVAVRIGGSGVTTVLHPSRLVVHGDPLVDAEGCWRCDGGVNPVTDLR